MKSESRACRIFNQREYRLERANVGTCLLQRALLHRRAELG